MPPPGPDATTHPLPRVALETTLLLHGVPRSAAPALAADLKATVASTGSRACLVGLFGGRWVDDLTDAQLGTLFSQSSVPKVNTSSLGAVAASGGHGATTVSTTMELAAARGIRVFATGGLGGVHPGLTERLDVSADLAAFTRFPVAVVTSGCKSILDVPSTRELLETLGVPVVGFRTDAFPAFYTRDSGVGVDARFDDPEPLARFLRHELARTGRGVVVANPIPAADEIPLSQWNAWLAAARAIVAAESANPSLGRDVTPRLLAAVHAVSGGATLRANIALVKNNALLAGHLARAMDA
jgi:pseudouridine-5'-phosphate glycosidase